VEIQAVLPFPLLGIDSDNGSEFINDHLLRWCVSQQITFTRSPPANKNDSCHVEQKNWDIARRTVGYWRYDTAGELAVLNQIWPTLSPLINLFTPQQKLVSKTRTGAKVTKRYDTAQTPYQQLLAHLEVLDDIDARALAASTAGPDQPGGRTPRSGPPVQHPARAGPPQDRHRPSPNRSHIPIQKQDQQAVDEADIFR
jgi:hypothetical protein